MGNNIKLEHVEFGSFYEKSDLVISDSPWINSDKTIFTSSGRDALFAIIKTVAKDLYATNKLTVWLPSYYCHPITEALAQFYRVRIYQSTPYTPSKIDYPFTSSDILVLVEFFGAPSLTSFSGSPIVLLDKTHNPLSEQSYRYDIDYSFGSLRKILPVADGGFIVNHNTTAQLVEELVVTDEHAKLFRDVKRAMKLKKDYLEVKRFYKNDFLELFQASESAFGNVVSPSRALTPIDELIYVDIDFYLSRRRHNSQLLKAYITARRTKMHIIESDIFFVIQFESEVIREKTKRALILNDIYPAVLWPADERFMTVDDLKFSRTTLVMPTDFRYDEPCFELLTQRVNKIMEEIENDD